MRSTSIFTPFSVHPTEKQHPKFNDVADIELPLLPREDQHGEEKVTKLTARDAVAKRVVDNETLAYYLVRTQLFLLAIGIKYEKLRFRQHKSTEMAHYASDVSDTTLFCADVCNPFCRVTSSNSVLTSSLLVALHLCF